jgi:DNA topoisomerase-1
MAIKLGRYGKFLACTGFPACRNAKPILTKTGVACPECGGDLVERRGGKSKRLFFGCANYPACSFSTWYRPVVDPCPRCGWLQVEAGREKVRCLRCEPGPEQRRAGKTAARRPSVAAATSSTAQRDGRASPRRAASRAKPARAKGGKVVGRTGAR